MAPILDVKDLHVDRGDTEILAGINWKVSEREHWVILGPNGCGKTSLLKTLTGYMAASRGRLAVFGHAYGSCDWRDLRLQIGMVSTALQASIPQAETAIDTVISGRYAQLDLWMPTKEADHRSAARWLRFFDIKDLAERPWLYLSQGERQRVLLARALMAKPKLLILDEPCSGLDPVAREHFLCFIRRLASEKRAPSLVLVTHHVEEITQGFTHALLLRKGLTVAAGPLRDVLTTRNLSEAFGARVVLRRSTQGYRLSVGGVSPKQGSQDLALRA